MPGATLLERALALALLAALVLGVVFLGVLPMLARMEAAHTDITEQRSLLARLERRVAPREAYEEKIAELSEQIARSPLFIHAETEPLAAAAIQEYVKRVAAGSGVELRSLQALEPADEHGLRRIRLRIVMAGTHEDVIHMLHALETGMPHLSAERLEISSNASRRRGRRSEGPDLLSVTMDLCGFLAPEVTA